MISWPTWQFTLQKSRTSNPELSWTQHYWQPLLSDNRSKLRDFKFEIWLIWSLSYHENLMMCYRYENSNTIFVIAKIPSYLGKKGLRNIQNWHDMQFCIYSSYIQYCETSSLQNDLLRSGLVLDQTWFVDLKFGDFGGFRWVCRLGL